MKILVYLLLFLPFGLFAQKEIQVSEDYTTILILPNEVEEPILGNEREYIIKPSSNTSLIGRRTIRLGYIKFDKVEKNTNLTVFTKDGNSYEFLLKYTHVPKELTHYIGLDESVKNLLGNDYIEEPNIKTKSVKVKSSYYSDGIETVETNTKTENIPVTEDLYVTDKVAYINRRCKSVNNDPKKLFRIYDKSGSIKLSLKEISYDKDELYLHLLLENKGGQTFDVDFINTRLSRGYKGVSTDQKISLTPLVVYERPMRVEGGTGSNFIMVFKKFTINDKKEFQIDLAEKNGERDLLLHINNKLINNPVKL